MEFTEFNISTSDDLQTLLASNPLWRKKLGLVVLSGDLKNHPQRSSWQSQLNAHYYYCGCDEGSNGFFIGVGLSVVWLASFWFRDITPTLTVFVAAIAIAVAGALIGKAFGKLSADRQLRRLIKSIQQEMAV